MALVQTRMGSGEGLVNGSDPSRSPPPLQLGITSPHPRDISDGSHPPSEGFSGQNPGPSCFNSGLNRLTVDPFAVVLQVHFKTVTHQILGDTNGNPIGHR